MKRATVMFPDDVDTRLRVEVRRRGVPIAQVVRDAVEGHLRALEPGRRLAFFATGEGTPDGSSRVDQVVLHAMRAR